MEVYGVPSQEESVRKSKRRLRCSFPWEVFDAPCARAVGSAREGSGVGERRVHPEAVISWLPI